MAVSRPHFLEQGNLGQLRRGEQRLPVRNWAQVAVIDAPRVIDVRSIQEDALWIVAPSGSILFERLGVSPVDRMFCSTKERKDVAEER